ncbi:hypothetical protein HanRHA438_Chr14g0665671 [Helianthus annuus]|nr:hypothetical protein HanRHA438_Chr14g0665671 [Helianthus annuus]
MQTHPNPSYTHHKAPSSTSSSHTTCTQSSLCMKNLADISPPLTFQLSPPATQPSLHRHHPDLASSGTPDSPTPPHHNRSIQNLDSCQLLDSSISRYPCVLTSADPHTCR